MSQTDRQTDKASNWKSAIFDVENNWSALDTPAPFVKTIYKQEEICPTTGKHHFQIHVVCHRQVRLTQMTSWIKKTKWIPVFGKEHIANSIKYCSKKESAVAGTYEQIQGAKYYQIHELLQEIAKYAEPNPTLLGHVNDWERITWRMLSTDLTWANRLSNPALRRMWADWGSLFVLEWEQANEATCGGFIIEPPQSEEDEIPPELEELNEVCLIE